RPCEHEVPRRQETGRYVAHLLSAETRTRSRGTDAGPLRVGEARVPLRVERRMRGFHARQRSLPGANAYRCVDPTSYTCPSAGVSELKRSPGAGDRRVATSAPSERRRM